MRIAALIFSTLLLVGTIALGFLGANRGFKDAGDIDKIYSGAKAEIAAAAAAGDSSAAELESLGEATGRLKAGAAFMAITGVLALGLLIVTFMGRPVIKPLAGATVAGAIIAVVLSPQYDLGPMAPASARSLGYVLAVMAVLGAAAAYGSLAARRGTSPRVASAMA
jgi:hypothetical protein